MNFHVLDTATNNIDADDDVIRFVNLRPGASFSFYKLATSSGKHSEEISHVHIVSLMYKLKTSPRDTDDSSIGFIRDRDRRQRDSTIITQI